MSLIPRTTHEILFLAAGVGIMLSFWFLDTGWGTSVWILAKGLYFTGIAFFLHYTLWKYLN